MPRAGAAPTLVPMAVMPLAGHGSLALRGARRGPRESRFLLELADRVGLPEELRRACLAVVLPAGARRLAADLPAARLLVVEEGVVLTRSPAGPGRRSMILARCTAGSVMPPPGPGEVLQSLTDAWITAVPLAAWRQLISFPEATERLLCALEETMARQQAAIHALAGIRHVDRVRSQLLVLAAEHGRVCRGGVRIDLPLTHDLLADMVGCARETVTRAVEELNREGFVVRRGRFYELLVAPETLSA
jgi:hypothetical protein